MHQKTQQETKGSVRVQSENNGLEWLTAAKKWKPVVCVALGQALTLLGRPLRGDGNTNYSELAQLPLLVILYCYFICFLSNNL